VSEKYSVVFVLEFYAESECVIVSLGFTLHRILVIANVLPVAVPTLLGFDLRIHQRLHSMIVERIWFEQIDNVEPVKPSWTGILDPEIIPLRVSSGAVIWLQNEVIFEFIDLNGSSEVA
jgi:hypothetical protein